MSQFQSLKPHLVTKVWGGENLKKIREAEAFNGPLGESWEVSCLEEGPCLVKKEDQWVSLNELISTEKLPYLVKYIDTTDNLSIQVHPGDEFARLHESSSGKTECWLILDSQVGSGIYLGLRPGITSAQIEMAIKNKEDLSKLLNFYPVKRGDFFFVPSGSIHAIGKGVTLAEIQQSSGITYRVWDWNRLGLDGKERELHIEKALKVVEFDQSKNSLEYFKSMKKLLSQEGRVELIRHRDFNVDLYNTNNSTIQIPIAKSQRLSSIVNLSSKQIFLDDYSLGANNSCLISCEKEAKTIECRISSTKATECISFLHIY